jgi:hypothetical protein
MQRVSPDEVFETLKALIAGSRHPAGSLA